MRIVGLDKYLLTLKGVPFTAAVTPQQAARGEAGKNLTLGDAIFEVAQRDMQGQTKAQMIASMEIAKKLKIPCAEVELKDEETVLLKEIAEKTAPKQFYVLFSDALDAGGIKDAIPSDNGVSPDNMVPIRPQPAQS